MRHFKLSKLTTFLIIGVLISLFVLFSLLGCQGSSTKSQPSNDELYSHVDEILSWTKQQQGTPVPTYVLDESFAQYAGDSNVDWYAIALGQLNIDEPFENYLAFAEKNVTERYKEPGQLDELKATEWHRLALGVISSGGDPTKIGNDKDGNPVNLINDGIFYREKIAPIDAQGVNGAIYALNTIDSLDYQVPDNALTTREDLIKIILSYQIENGGFSLSGDDSTSVDITAMALQALAPYYNNNEIYTYTLLVNGEEVSKSVQEAIDESLKFLVERQQTDGNFGKKYTSCESTAQVIIALTSLGIDIFEDERFVQDGTTAYDGLLHFMNEDGGFYNTDYYPEGGEPPTKESNIISSQQALCAITALIKQKDQGRAFYDFRPPMSEDLQQQINLLKEDIAELEASEDQVTTEQIEQLEARYLAIPESERSYVFNYVELSKLSDTLQENEV